jgi:hypothetical protein
MPVGLTGPVCPDLLHFEEEFSRKTVPGASLDRPVSGPGGKSL